MISHRFEEEFSICAALILQSRLRKKTITEAACEEEVKRGGQVRSGTNICSSSSSPLILVRVAVPAAQIKGHASATQHLGLSTNAHTRTH